MISTQTAAQAAELEDQLVEETWNELQKRNDKAANGTITAGPEPAPTQSVDELAAELKSHPFFATSVDDIGEDNEVFEALKALAYDGTRAENAENFREQGNEAARSKDWPTAKEFYSKALGTLRAERRDDEVEDLEKQGPGWEKTESDKETDIKEKCLANRALCNLSLKNYRSCSIDCIGTLEINPRNVKAHYRLAQALLSLGKLEEASKAALAGLAVEPENGSLLKIKDAVAAAIEAHERQERRRKAEAERKAQEEHVLRTALQARQIKMRSTPNPPDLEDAKLTLTPDPLSPTSSLVFPVLILYPLNAQSDFVKNFGEEETIANHMGYLLPSPWDVEAEYGDGRGDKVDAYLETSQGGLVKWGRKVELLRLLSGGKVEVVNGIVTVNIVPKARAEEWITEFKRRKGGGG